MEDWVYNQYLFFSNLNEMQWLNNTKKKNQNIYYYAT